MSLRINTNIMAINTHRNMAMTDLALSKSLEKLSSGLRVNRAADDAAGLSISENLRAQIRGLAQAERNAQDGISLINVAEGAMNETHSILQRMRELAVQAANGTLSASDRASVDSEFDQLRNEIGNIATNTKFNGKTLFDGTFSESLQVGANAGESITVTIDEMDATAAPGVGGVDISGADLAADAPTASAAITIIDNAIRGLSASRSELGAITNRLEYTINNVAISRENMMAAESRIRDVDMAAEMGRLTRAQILMQSGTAMLAQANMSPQSVMGLLA